MSGGILRCAQNDKAALEEESGSDKGGGGDNGGEADGAKIPDGITANSLFTLRFKGACG